MAHRLLVESLERSDATFRLVAPREARNADASQADLEHEGSTAAPSRPDDRLFEALLLRAGVLSAWADLDDLEGWQHRSATHRRAAIRVYDSLLDGVHASSTVAGWTEQIEAGVLDARMTHALVGAGRVHRQLGHAEMAAMWLQGALLVSSVEHEAILAAAAFVELAETMAADHERAVGFLRSALECLSEDEPHPLRAAALARLAEEGWRAGQGDEAEQILVRAEDDASSRGDIVRLAECRSLRGDVGLSESEWALAAERYLEFADILIDAYPLYVAGRMAHRASAMLDLAESTDRADGAAEACDAEACDAALKLARCGQVGLSTQVDTLRELLTDGDDVNSGGFETEDLTPMGELCAAVGRDLVEVERRARIEAPG